MNLFSFTEPSEMIIAGLMEIYQRQCFRQFESHVRNVQNPTSSCNDIFAPREPWFKLDVFESCAITLEMVLKSVSYQRQFHYLWLANRLCRGVVFFFIAK